VEAGVIETPSSWPRMNIRSQVYPVFSNPGKIPSLSFRESSGKKTIALIDRCNSVVRFMGRLIRPAQAPQPGACCFAGQLLDLHWFLLRLKRCRLLSQTLFSSRKFLDYRHLHVTITKHESIAWRPHTYYISNQKTKVFSFFFHTTKIK
jgi:hypothetical protein